MSNKNWVCSACGRTFARKFSAQRHVNHLEGGLSTIVRKDQYELGVRTGAFFPRSHKPTYKKNDVRLVDLFGQKLKEKIANMLADNVLRDPEQSKLVIAMFLTENIQEGARSNDGDEFTKFLSRRMGQFRRP